jgi:RHS repeat-associated protein
MKTLLGYASLLVLPALLVPLPVFAQQPTILYVDATDLTCGGQSPCFSTIQAAINAAGPGNVIRVQAGTYPEQLAITGKNNFQGVTEFDRIIIEADPATQPGQVVLTGAPGACTGNHAIRLQQSKFITIRGLTITGTGGQAISLLGGSNQNQDIHIELNRIFGNGSSSCNGGITVARGNPGTLIVNNLLHSNGRNGIAFIDADGGPHYIINNTVVSNQWNGVDVARSHTITLANNIIVSNGVASGITGGRYGIRREGSTNPQPAGIKLLSNLVCGNVQGEISPQILDSTDSSNFTPLGDEGQGVGALPGCELSDNLFGNVNGVDGLPNTIDDDFNLKANSLAIDVGMDPRTLGFNPSYNPIFEADFVVEGIRPADGNADRTPAFDAGAFEFPNAPPTANAGANQTVTTGQLVTLNGTQSSDPEGATLTFQWTIVTQPGESNISLTGATTAIATLTPVIPGQYIFQLIVNDGQLASAPSTVIITAVNANQPPTANAGGPYTGFVNIPIQLSGSGSDPDGNPINFSWAFGDGGAGLGATPTHTYTATGTYTVTLTVTDSFGASAISQTTATIGPSLVLNPIGNKTVNLGETLTFTVKATHSGGGSVGLFVAPLPLIANASFNASTGQFTFRPSTTQAGVYQLTFTATVGTTFASESITITVPNPPPGGTTSVRGRVVNLAQTPLSNVMVTLKSSGHTALSGADGFFTIAGIPSGTQQLLVNGRQSNLGVYAILAIAVELIDGVLNNLSGAISLPDVDVDAEVQVSPTFNTVVTNPSLPGVELEIIGGSATNPDGTPFTGKLSINPVPDYGRPESRPEELRPGMAVTIQPAGIRFNPPARITFPNADGMAANNDLNLWSLSPDTGKFNIVGKSTVSADGQSIITVEGGVTASAWHFPLATATTSNPNQGNNFCGSCRTQVGSEANLEEGSLYLSHSLPSYRSLGQSRSVSLTYSSVTADPKPIISLDSTLARRAAVPNTFSTRLRVGGVQQGEEVFTNSSSLLEDSESTSRFSIQFDASTLATGRYPFEATVFSNYLNSSVGGISNGNTIVVNRSGSAFGSGWAVTELQQLQTQSSGGVLLTTGDGTALFFSGGPATFTSPPRDFSTLVKNPDETYTRTFKDGGKVNFNAQGLQTAVIDRNGNTTSFAYDGTSRLITITDPVGLVTTFNYSGGKLQSITDPAGRQTLFQHDAAGALRRITNPDSSFVAYSYDAKGRLTQATDERGQTTTYAYDFAGRFAQSIRPGGETRGLVSTKLLGLVDTMSGQGTPTNPAPIVPSQQATASLSDGRGNQSRFALDALGQVTSQTNALGHTTTTVRDANGLPLRVTRPNGAVTTMNYDGKGNLLTATDPLGATTAFTYEPAFNLVKTIRDPKGNTTTINYDVKGNPVEIIDALNTRTQMTYDSRGLVTSVIAAVGTPVQTTTTFTYDARGNLLTTTNPKGDVTTFAYDNAGNVGSTTDAENRVTQFSYDARNRLVMVLDADLKTTQYGYDPKGNLTQVRDAKNQITTFVFDALDRLASATNPLGLSETFAYDGNGNLTSTINRNGQTLRLDYDALNRLTSKTRPPTSTEAGDQSTTYTYDAVGNLTSVSNPTVNVFNQYDAANRLVSSLSTTETALADTVVPINVDTTINANDLQFEGKTLQVNGRALTVNGAHTFANLTFANGAVLTHGPTTATGTAKLEITVTGTLQVDATSRIDATGRGFLGHVQPGNIFIERGMTFGFQPGSVCASGGGYGGSGGISGCSAAASNPVYGDFKNPNDGGSGGGGVLNGLGGNGGGLIRIVAQNLQLQGAIVANGQNGQGDRGAGGSGGGIRIDVATLQGAGSITARGGNGGPTGSSPAVGTGGAGGGRIAIYYQNATGFNFANVLAQGGTGNSAANGGAGTVYLQGPGRETGELIVDNNNVPAAALTTPISQLNTITLSHFRVRRQARARIGSDVNVSGTLELSSGAEYVTGSLVTANTLNISANGVMNHVGATGTTFDKLFINATSLTIDATSRIDVTGRGFLGHVQPGNNFIERGMTAGFQPGSVCASGGGHGGLGGFSGCSAAASNPVYGDFRNPNDAGSGGGGVLNGLGGNGGGLVRIVAQTLQLDGTIMANGQNGQGDRGAGGSGGGIRIDVGTLQGTGGITARGGNGGPTGSSPAVGTGGGGGGRIAIYYQNAAGFNFGNVLAQGGTGNSAPNGGAGTVYLQGPGREAGELIINNNNLIGPSLSTPVPSSPSGILMLTHLRVMRGANTRIDDEINLSESLEVAFGLGLSGLEVGKRVVASSIAITNESFITHLPATGVASYKVDLAANTINIDATSRIGVTGRGFLGANQTGNTFSGRGMTHGFVAGSSGRSGGGYGGFGGAVAGGSNALYGNTTNPNEPGSGGAAEAGVLGGTGGGVVRIVAQTLQLDGSIRSFGNVGSASTAGGGSGGAIRIDVGTLGGSGQIIADGGSSGGSAGGGGGGRIAIYYGAAPSFNFATQLFARGGSGGVPGQNGTVHVAQQVAMNNPMKDSSPTMLAHADIDGSQWNATRIGEQADVIGLERAKSTTPLQSIFVAGESIIQNSESEIGDNLYLALVKQGTLKRFASTLVNDETVASENMSGPSNIELDDLDPIYTYDLNGNRLSMIDPTGLTTYTYDALNRLTSITNNKNQTTTFAYDALSRRTSVTRANGVVTSYTYDAASQLTRLAHQLGATSINAFDYVYDRVGNRTSKTSRDGAHNYTYDVLNRLSQAVNPLPSNPLETFNYDAVGNRTNSNQNGSSTFNLANQLLEDANFTYQYDNNGNTIRKTAKAGSAITTYEYDAENRLVRAVSPSNTVDYRYDGIGRRVEKLINAGTTTVTKYVYDHEDILLELSAANAIVARYTHGPGIDEPLIMEKSGQSFYYHADGLSSITDITNHTGNIAQRYTYSSYGKIASESDPNFVQPYTYTSRELDQETGLYYYRARYYESATGRFISEDPVGFTAGPNFYPYVGNNPIVRIDPTGLFVTPDTLIDVGFILYDIYKLIADGSCAFDENLAALGLDIIGAVAPGVTGLGAASRVARNADEIYVIGRRWDTVIAKDWPGHKILDIPDWSLAKNDEWVQKIIDQRAKVYVGSPMTKDQLVDALTNDPTVFARELRQFESAGYRKVGDYLIPPGR